jgi:hypothetical protein
VGLDPMEIRVTGTRADPRSRKGSGASEIRPWAYHGDLDAKLRDHESVGKIISNS